MLFTIENPFEISVVIYLGLIALLFITKPDFIFDNPKIYYKFGLGNNDKDHSKRKTMMPLWLLFLILAVVIYYTVAAYTCQQNHEFYCKKILSGEIPKMLKTKCQ